MSHSMILILPLICLLDLHLTADASDCIDLWPYNPRGIDGESLRMVCSILPECPLKPSDLTFSIDPIGRAEVEVDHRLVTILNETAIQLTYPRVDVSFNEAYVYCKLRKAGGDMDSMVNLTAMESFDVQRLSVGYRPFIPLIKEDYKVFNWEYFEFQWTVDKTDNVYFTIYEPWFKRSTDPDFINCGVDMKRSKREGQINGKCRILNALSYVHPNGMLFFKVNASNIVDSISTDVIKASLYHIIQPGSVKNITVVSSVETGVNVSFYAPEKNHRLKYNISIHCGSLSWNSNISTQKSPVWLKLHHPFPPFAECHLSITCLPFYNRQYWSKPSESVLFVSPDAVPMKSPEICCIEIKPINSAVRGVTVYFKPLTDGEARGIVTRYLYHLTSLGIDEKLLPHSEGGHLPPNATSLPFQLYEETNSTVKISAETRAGRNHSIASRLSIPSQNKILPPPGNTTAIRLGPEIIRVSWMKVGYGFSYRVVWCQSASISCMGSVNWSNTELTSLDVELPKHSSFPLYRFGIVASSHGNMIGSIKWIKCIYNVNEVASVPRVRLFNKTSSSIYLSVEKPVDCANGDRGYIYEYQIEYTNGEEIINVANPAFDEATEDWLFAFSSLNSESNYTFSIVAMTSKGPSVKCLHSVSTDSTGKLKGYLVAWITVGSIVGALLISLGIFTCCKWNKQQIMKLLKWFRIDVKVPNKLTLDDRGIADGNIIPSSYASLSKKESSQPFLDLSDVKSEEESLRETVFFAEPNEMNSVDSEKSSENKNSSALKKGTPVKSPSYPTSFQKHQTSNLNDNGTPPKFTSADQVNQAAQSKIDFVGGDGVEQKNSGEESEGLLSRQLSRRSASNNSEISGSGRDVETGSRSISSAEQNSTLHRNNEGNDLGEIDIEHCYSTARTSTDGRECDEIHAIPEDYSLARLPSDDGTEDEAGYGGDYSIAVLSDDMLNNFSEFDQPPVQLDANFTDGEDDEHDDVSYSRASMIRRSKL